MTDISQTADATSSDPAADVAAVLDLLTGGWVAQTLRAVALLNIADHLADGPRTAEEIAKLTDSHPHTTFRLMRAAAALRVLSYEGDRRFGLTGRGHLLRSDLPGSLRSLVLIQNAHGHWQSWEHFPEAVRQGRAQTKRALGVELFDYFARPENAEEAALFSRAMGDLSGLVVQGAVAAIDTTRVQTVVDIGGADGDLVLGLMAANPTLQGQVLEQSYVVEGARREARKRGLEDRFSAIDGDFFEEIPPADLYILKQIMHDWDDEHCTKILRNCRAAINEGGRTLVIEMVIGELGKPDFATRVDMDMLCVSQGGMERDLDEYDALFAASGWRRERTYPVGGGYSVLELTAV